MQTIPLVEGDDGCEIVDEVANGLSQFQDRPVLIGWGLKDFVFDRHFLAEWERRFPQATVMRFADAGHYILEDASDEMIAGIKQFMSQPLPVGADRT